mmetsp:Transcript_112349/g.194849  ORF Transcript_112349/g.194849 Transcript_112349/m.194849 type:complete len:157 (+) Transcript_112349:69-539(+)
MAVAVFPVWVVWSATFTLGQAAVTPGLLRKEQADMRPERSQRDSKGHISGLLEAETEEQAPSRILKTYGRNSDYPHIVHPSHPQCPPDRVEDCSNLTEQGRAFCEDMHTTNHAPGKSSCEGFGCDDNELYYICMWGPHPDAYGLPVCYMGDVCQSN